MGQQSAAVEKSIKHVESSSDSEAAAAGGPPSDSGTGTTIKHHEPSRSSNWVGATAHIITAVIGAGVLSLPFSMAVLGWVGGPIMILLFAWITLKTSVLLADCYYVRGKRNRTYRETVHSVFGRTGDLILGWLQYTNLWLTAVAYNITGAISMQNIAARACQIQGKDDETCDTPNFWVFATIFGGCQVFMSQLPNMDSSIWSSIIGAAMSVCYSFITIGLSIGKISQGNHHGNVRGLPGELIYPDESNVNLAKTMGIFNAFGTIVFSFSFSMILIEIQDTIRKGPASNKYGSRASLEGMPKGAIASTGKGAGAVADEADGGEVILDDRDRFEIVEMRRAVTASLYVITFFFLLIAVLGYLSFGDDSCGNILSCFKNPAWLIIMANTMVLIHVVSAYQVYSQPVFYFCENYLHNSRLPISFATWPARVVFRTLYAVVACIIAILLPFFWDMVGLVGALGFWPTTVIFPIEMWVRVYKPKRSYYIFLECINVVAFLLTLCATAGAIYSIYIDSSSYSIFGS